MWDVAFATCAALPQRVGRDTRRANCFGNSQRHCAAYRTCCSVEAGSSRRTVLKAIALAIAGSSVSLFPSTSYSGNDYSASAVPEVDKSEAMKQLKRVTILQENAFQFTNVGNFQKADAIWTEIISLNEQNAAAWSNRGNCRTSQGRFYDAIQDFDVAIELVPSEPDPHLGKGVALEGLRDYPAALREYEIANDANIARYGVPDPVTFNNRGNVYGVGMGDWAKAVDYFHLAGNMSRQYVFPRANEALALYQLGKKNEAVKMMETLLRKYPDFPDIRAALVAIYWTDKNRRGDAESYWSIVMNQDVRYKESEWVKNIRKWPPLLAKLLNEFLDLTVTED